MNTLLNCDILYFYINVLQTPKPCTFMLLLTQKTTNVFFFFLRYTCWGFYFSIWFFLYLLVTKITSLFIYFRCNVLVDHVDLNQPRVYCHLSDLCQQHWQIHTQAHWSKRKLVQTTNYWWSNISVKLITWYCDFIIMNFAQGQEVFKNLLINIDKSQSVLFLKWVTEITGQDPMHA